MKLVIISGLSGAGKSVALHALEDEGFHCIDNLPAKLLRLLTEKLASDALGLGNKVAVSVDIRSLDKTPGFDLGPILAHLREEGVETDVIFIKADEATLLRRYSEALRLHPLSHKADTLKEAIELERRRLDDTLRHADLIVDTTELDHRRLGERLRAQVGDGQSKLSVLVQSFGYKKGVPPDSDFVFDVRCLLNPYWEPRLRHLTGRDAEVAAFLESDAACDTLFDQLLGFVTSWIERFEKGFRNHLTLSIGCTGGQHRSVYLAERLHAALSERGNCRVNKYHRECD